MSNEDVDDDIRQLRQKLRKSDHSVDARRARETRIPSYASRRKASGPQRTEQTNLKFTKETKRRLLALSAAAGESMIEYIERAIEVRARSEAQ